MRQSLSDVSITGGYRGGGAGPPTPKRCPPPKCPKNRGNEPREKAGDAEAECLGCPPPPRHPHQRPDSCHAF
jgi:hypothetical protein